MDQDRFDALTRTLATTTSRRTVLKTLAGSAAGGLLAMLGVGEATAAKGGCKATGKKCKRDDECCSGTCANGTCRTPTTCTPDNVVACAGKCNTATNNCGETVTCGSCPGTQVCQSDNTCCIPSDQACGADDECCSGSCDSMTGTCTTIVSGEQICPPNVSNCCPAGDVGCGAPFTYCEGTETTCTCAPTIDGKIACVHFCTETPCASNDDCDPGYVCSCCGEDNLNVCMQVCPS